MILKNIFFINLFLFVAWNFEISQASPSKLTALVIVTKHAEKGIETSYPSDPYLNNEKAFPNGPNRLTNKGKEDCIAFGKTLKEKYGVHLRSGSNLIATVDDRAFGIETAELIFNGLFGWKSSFAASISQSENHRRFLFGPDDCPVLRRRIRRTLRSSQVKNLFNENKQLIQNITGSNRNDAKLIKNVPVVYESIETELNNYLKQPDWLNESAVDKLKQLTTDLDRLYYQNELINQLQVGQLLGMIRMNLIDNVLKVPNFGREETRLGYSYVVGSDQFSALLNALDIYEGRPKFASSLVMELDDQSNVHINFYDSKRKAMSEKQISCDDKEDGCKLVPFLKKLDKLVPIDIGKSCLLPKPRLIEPDYEELFNSSTDASRDRSTDDQRDDNLDDDTDLAESERRERRKDRIRKFVEEKFDEMINKYKELISWLSDLFVRRAEARRNRKERDSADELRDRLVEILEEKIKRVDDPKKRQKLIELLEKFKSSGRGERDESNSKKNSKSSIIENSENQIKMAISEKELLAGKQRNQLAKLIDKIKEFDSMNSSQRMERMDKLSKHVNETIVEICAKFNEKMDDLGKSVSKLLEDKFNQIRKSYDVNRLNGILYEIENKLRLQLDESKLKREERLKDIRNLFNKLVNDENMADKKSKLDELREEVKNLDVDDKEVKSNPSEYKNPEYAKVNELIEQLPNQRTIEIETNDDATNEELLKVEKIKDKLREIVANIVSYLETNKDNEQQIEEDIAKFNDYLQTNKKISVGLLTRLARSCQNETIKESIKEVIKDAIEVVKLTNHNILTVETDLSTLINEIEETNRSVANQQFNLTTFSTNLTEPPKLLRAENQSEKASAFSFKTFGVTVAIVAGTMIVIAVFCLILRKYQKRKNYTKV